MVWNLPCKEVTEAPQHRSLVFVCPLLEDSYTFLLNLLCGGEELWLLAFRVLGIRHHVGWHSICLLDLRLSFGLLDLHDCSLVGLLHSSILIATDHARSIETSILLDLRTAHEARHTCMEAAHVVTDLSLLLTELHGLDRV